MYKRILMPYDDSEASKHALQEALALAEEHAAQLRIIHVIDVTPPETDPTITDLQAYEHTRHAEGQRVLDQARQQTYRSRIKPEFELIASSMPLGDEIIAEVRRWSANLIVMGTHGRSGLAHRLMGRVAEGVVRRTPVPVLLFRDM